MADDHVLFFLVKSLYCFLGTDLDILEIPKFTFKQQVLIVFTATFSFPKWLFIKHFGTAYIFFKTVFKCYGLIFVKDFAENVEF